MSRPRRDRARSLAARRVRALRSRGVPTRRLALGAASVLGLAFLAVVLVRPARWWALQRGLDAAAAVPWIAPDALADALASDTPPALLDVRPQHEVALGTIPGARQVDPNTDPAALADTLGGRQVVVYCSVGARSGTLARGLAAQGVAVRNLRGSIFQWANDGRPLVTASGAPTQSVHPYDAYWGLYLRPSARADTASGRR